MLKYGCNQKFIAKNNSSSIIKLSQVNKITFYWKTPNGKKELKDNINH